MIVRMHARALTALCNWSIHFSLQTFVHLA